MIFRKINDADDRRQIGRIYEESWKYAYKDIVSQDYLDGIQADSWAKRIDDTNGIDVAVITAENKLVTRGAVGVRPHDDGGAVKNANGH